MIISDLKKNIKRLIDEKNSIIVKYNHLHKKNENLTNQIHTLTNDTVEYKSKIIEINKELTKLKKENELYKSSIDNNNYNNNCENIYTEDNSNTENLNQET